MRLKVFRSEMSRRPAGWCVLAAILLMIGGVSLASLKGAQKDLENRERLAKALPRQDNSGPYVTSERCANCHESEHASWHRTFHRTMTQAATPENVVGAFDGSAVVSGGLTYRVFRRGDVFFAEMPDPDEMMYVVEGGKKLAFKDIPRVQAPVVMTTGSHHYQTYWVSSPRYERLMQTLPLVYLIKDRRWIPREAAFMTAPEKSGPLVTQWNHHCIRCHSTGGNPGLNPKTGMLNTQVAEFGIACEACHGPGEKHSQFMDDPLQRSLSRSKGSEGRFIVNPSKLDHRASSQICGQCHGVFIMRDEYAMEYAQKGVLFRPGDDLDKTRYYIQYPTKDSPPDRQEDIRRNPEFFRERWWDDGTVLAGGREYTALSVSSCYTRGEISCLSCHSMHESEPNDLLREGADSVRSCTKCHEEAKYNADISQHTFHTAGSSGSNCLNCHMPHITYALFGAIRSHQIASPNLVSTVRLGVPNACNLCHLDRTLAWTQENLVQRYGAQPLPLTDDQKRVSAALLWLLKGHAAQRVIAAWHLGWQPAQQVSGVGWLAPSLAQLLSDPYGVVRYVAEHALRTIPGFEGIDYDFLSAESELKQAIGAAIKIWKGQEPERRHGTPEVLVGSDSQFMENRVRELLLQRDNRPVTIKE